MSNRCAWNPRTKRYVIRKKRGRGFRSCTKSEVKKVRRKKKRKR